MTTLDVQIQQARARSIPDRSPEGTFEYGIWTANQQWVAVRHFDNDHDAREWAMADYPATTTGAADLIRIVPIGPNFRVAMTIDEDRERWPDEED